MQEKEFLCLDEKYSTTRLVTKQQPLIFRESIGKINSMLSLPSVPGRKGEGGLRTKGYFKESLNDQILISVITVVFNGEKFLERTIHSVISQCYDNVEYIIIDGGSTDLSLDIIKKYEEFVDYWVSESDNGIYDAMNKGIKLSSGQLLNHLNSGDSYTSEHVLCKVYSDYKEKGWPWCYGKQNLLNADGSLKGITDPPYFSEILLKITNFVPHQTVFIERQVFEEYGYFDTDIKLSSDYLFWLRIYDKYRPQKLDNFILIDFLEGGAASNPREVLLDFWNAKNSKLKRNFLWMILEYVLIHILWIKYRLGIRGVKNHISSFQSFLMARRS